MGDAEIEQLLRDKFTLMQQHRATVDHLRAELTRAVREINRLGEHAVIQSQCPVCAVVKSFGLPESDVFR